MNVNDVDIVAYDKETDSICLVIADFLVWDDIDFHLSTLQEKLLYYVSYIESKEISKKFQSKKNLVVNIKVVFQHEAPAEGIRFIEQAMLVLEETGYKLSYCNYN